MQVCNYPYHVVLLSGMAVAMSVAQPSSQLPVLYTLN